jgi:gliding motility-associated-like protein
MYFSRILSMFYKKTLLFFLLTIISLKALPAIFVVTNNADAGSGTLREALTLAAANGSATTDYINFNFPDLSEAGRTIKLLSQLPDVSSNLIIDGSTQPGAKFGVSDAKVGLFYQPSIVQDLSGLKFFEQHDVKVLGLYIKYFKDPNQTWNYLWKGLEITNGNDIQIGDLGKGIVVSGFTNPLSVNESTPPGGILRWYIQNITIKDSFFGLESDGKTFSQSSDGLSTLRSVLGQIIIDGNIFFKGLTINQNNGYDVPSPYVEVYQTLPADIRISNNKIGINYDNTTSSFGTFGLSLNTSGSLGKNTYHIEDNLIENQSFNAINIINNGAPIYILRNYIGVDKSLQKGFRNGGINLNTVSQVQIGDSDPANANYIAHCKPVSITSSQANFPNKVSVNKNSFFCTEDAYPMYLRTEGVFIPSVSITSLSTTSVKGTATPNSSVELFYSDLCGTCSPETYFASVTADANGNWEYNGPISRTVIASATINGNTSEFTKLDIDVSLVKIINACNGLGSITGVVPKNATGFKWVDINGNVVATTADLLNVPPGKYKMQAQNGSCSAESIYYQIINALQVASTNVQIKNSSCNNADGAITGLVINNLTSGQAKYSWKNSTGTEIATTLDLKNVTAGAYTFTATAGDGSCTQTYGPVTIQNTTGPNINQSQIAVVPSNCGQSIGSITGITATGSGTLTYSWKNAQQQVVGTAANLLNQPAGVYILEVNDSGSQCGPIYTPAITIPEVNSVTMDESAALLLPPSCNKSDGAVKGIKVTGAITYAWYNSSNVVVSNNVDLVNVPTGNYYLVASSSTCSKTSKTYAVIQTVNLITVSGLPIIINDQCSQKTGSIKLDIAGGAAPYKYTWTDGSNEVVANTLDINNLSAGIYTLTITDASPCGIFTVTYTLQNQDIILPQPLVNNVNTCSSGNITLSVNNVSATYKYRLYDEFNSLVPLAEEKSGRFSVNVKNSRSYYITQCIGQCESTKTEVKVNVGISSHDIANAFTPNGDGINDYWKITGIENSPDALVQVFNRFGEKVFDSKGYSQPFDGSYKGQKLATGTYYYIINLKANCNILSGSLSIIR